MIFFWAVFNAVLAVVNIALGNLVIGGLNAFAAGLCLAAGLIDWAGR